MTGEIEMGGVFIPIVLVSAVAGFLLAMVLRRGLRAAHAYAYIWHAGLFDVALFIVLWTAVDYLGSIHALGMFK
jgi:protein AaeX